ncbi:CoA pyrophosphatase [Mangrovimonas sp. DI 80]|uniref:NUDIX hydrolase n=1 Tax=Mangrovimonas sp. DI 80 TaxID=1779330 RepID=UPI000975E1FE|nr:CoA pyrophosphatase [Mangrovimonas sp. DI 80]OMP32778.1 coenzyme A pyrophosphatase [Mangrovimonas sp. DI 80]
MEFDAFTKLVSKIKNLPLPGEASQIKMSPPFRLEFMKQQEQAIRHSKNAGVMALFYPDEKLYTKLVLILRKTYKGVHSAQVGFPGGRYEQKDQNLEETALRETHEEIGVPMTDIDIVKPLTRLYIPPSNFTVYPFLGVTNKTPSFIKQEDEVEDLIEVPFGHFVDEGSLTSAFVNTSYKKNVEVPAFKLNNHIVWGATAMMLSELKDLLKQAT